MRGAGADARRGSRGRHLLESGDTHRAGAAAPGDAPARRWRRPWSHRALDAAFEPAPTGADLSARRRDTPAAWPHGRSTPDSSSPLTAVRSARPRLLPTVNATERAQSSPRLTPSAGRIRRAGRAPAGGLPQLPRDARVSGPGDSDRTTHGDIADTPTGLAELDRGCDMPVVLAPRGDIIRPRRLSNPHTACRPGPISQAP